MRILAGILLLSILGLSCQPTASVGPDGDLTAIPYKPIFIELHEPSRFVKMQTFEDNPLTEAGVELGRQLFYDPILSRDSTRSCSSCHIQAFGFSDTTQLSFGVEDRKGKRNAIALTNLGYHYTQFFWDGRVSSLEEQALIPVEDSLELGSTWEEVEWKLQQHPDYPIAFRAAFGIKHVKEVDRYWAAKAIAQFERTFISANSKFDQVLEGKATLTAAEERGRLIFFDESETLPTGECAHCHVGPLLTTLTFFNNGLDDTDRALRDVGLSLVSGNEFDRGKFKTPSLRNIELTAPYMHDGRFNTLAEVIEQYNKGGHYSKNESPNIRPLGLNDRDKADLIAFLHTLTDTSYLERQDLSNPFLP